MSNPQTTVRDNNNNNSSNTSGDNNHNDTIVNRLFDPERKQRPDIWQFIKLVAPTEEKKKWKSKEATSAYCLKCRKVINYTRGTSQQILRHMISFHSEYLGCIVTPSKKIKLEQQANHNKVKKMRTENESVTEKGNMILLKWITESCRPLSILEDPGLIKLARFMNTSETKYSFPSRTAMTSLLKTTYMETKVSIQSMILRECEFYTLTSDIWSSHTANTYISLMIHYLTEKFQMKVVTLKCVPFSDVHHSGEETAKIIKASLEEVRMPLENMVVYVTDNCSNSAKSRSNIGINVNQPGCVAHTINSIVQKFIYWKSDGTQISNNGDPEDLGCISQTIGYLREYVKHFNTNVILSNWLQKSMENSGETPKKIRLDVTSCWKSTVSMLKTGIAIRVHLVAFSSYIQTPEGRKTFSDCCDMVQITHEQWFLLENVCRILERFLEATEAMSGEKYPTWSLTLPILRMVMIHLTEFEVTHGYSQCDWYDHAISIVELFREELLTEFSERFQEVQKSLLWTIFLDPRLTSMNGFTPEERNIAKNDLLNQMRNVPPSIESMRHQKQGIDDDANIGSSKSSMMLKNIFAKASDQTDELENLIDPMEADDMEMNKYISLCEQTTIRDPLQWWNTNREDFPVLAWLSRKWLAAVSTSLSSERLFSRSGTTMAARRSSLEDGDHVEMLTYVHDNRSHSFKN